MHTQGPSGHSRAVHPAAHPQRDAAPLGLARVRQADQAAVRQPIAGRPKLAARVGSQAHLQHRSRGEDAAREPGGRQPGESVAALPAALRQPASSRARDRWHGHKRARTPHLLAQLPKRFLQLPQQHLAAAWHAAHHAAAIAQQAAGAAESAGRVCSGAGASEAYTSRAPLHSSNPPVPPPPQPAACSPHLLRLLTGLAGDMKVARERLAAAAAPPLRLLPGVGFGRCTARPRLPIVSPARSGRRREMGRGMRD